MSSPSPSEPRTPSLYHAGLVVLAAIFVVYASQMGLALAGAPPIAAVGVSLVAAIAIVVGADRRWPGLAGLRRARPRYFAAAACVGAGLWFISLIVVTLVFPSPKAKGLQRLVTESNTLLTVAVVAVLPAIAEELIFRGALARALARRFGIGRAVLASALAFSLYHLQPVQMLPTLLLGLALGYIAIRADSALPTMVAHATNNVIATALAREPWFVHAITRYPVVTLATCTALVAIGLAIAASGARA